MIADSIFHALRNAFVEGDLPLHEPRFASNKQRYVHDEVSHNSHMPNLKAALGCAQLEQLPDFLASKRRLFERYQVALADIDEVRLMREPSDCESNYWLQTLILSDPSAERRDLISQATNKAGLMTRPAWQLMHQLEQYPEYWRAPLPIVELFERRIVNLPSGAGLA